MKFCDAAVEKLPVSTTSQNTFSVSICMRITKLKGACREVKKDC
jgi:hypothetical protein